MHIRDVCQAGEKIGKVCEEKLVLKMENAIQNREEQLKTIQERLLEHVCVFSVFFSCFHLQSQHRLHSQFLYIASYDVCMNVYKHIYMCLHLIFFEI